MLPLKNLTKKKIVILGASLPMLLFAYYLKKKKIDVTIMNNSWNVGGAWQRFKYQDLQIRKQSNIIVPVNEIEEKNQTKINN
ncbi:NAD(P)/FAD-dependent oxidoreductase, partial [Candidatus Pelagibacter sp.]|nr:NAD(P)/FAD-dependent oxidoreductase [Candidatus Pelagibacter sp.]